MASAQSSTKLKRPSKPVEAAAMAGVNEAAIEDASVAQAEVEGGKSKGGQKSSGLSVVIDGFLNLLSSVPFGIVLLVLLIIACMIGMLIQQQELETFPAYYAALTPAEKVVYGRLGFFDIYHAAYFNLLLLLLSLNIILASIDHFPASWSFVMRKKLTASPTFAMAQKFKEKVELPQLDRPQLAERAVAAARKMRFRARLTEANDRTTIFAERGVWNRLGAYAVHIGLLTIFFGYFLTSRGHTGSMDVVPGKKSNVIAKNEFSVDNATEEHAIGTRQLQIPFTVECLDFQQKLIDKNGSLDATNTLDWITRVRIVDPEIGKTTDTIVHLNSPLDYRGYRFFQNSVRGPNNARVIKLRVTPMNATINGGQPQEVTIQRNGEAKLADGTRLQYSEFNPSFSVGSDQQVQMPSGEYENPAAHLAYVMPDGKQGDVWALNETFAKTVANAPFMRKFMDNGVYQFVLTDFEKAPTASILSVQFDPGASVVYAGFTILCLMLIAVFFFSHQRLWIVVEDGNVYLGGDANRNRLGFEDRAKKVAALIREPQSAG
ncbi:MAG TPA: cytochrome c biogenesis protein ResB [Blastocatellia bacterium]|jgi:cytochrome c biogenesis protein|nr:cytochrome c biogenesis protein ResB [Blastocatellia bacterium]